MDYEARTKVNREVWRLYLRRVQFSEETLQSAPATRSIVNAITRVGVSHQHKDPRAFNIERSIEERDQDRLCVSQQQYGWLHLDVTELISSSWKAVGFPNG